jgi:hypothetical protein
MKTLLIAIGTLMFAVACGQTKSVSNPEIVKVLKEYASSGDQQNVQRLSSVLHDQYRLVWYGGKDDPFIVDKSGFLTQFEKKEWGGDKRTVTVESIEVFDGINATAKVVMDGNAAEMRSLFSLIKVGDDWKIIGELVNATFK